jgi:hypothetical protein
MNSDILALQNRMTLLERANQRTRYFGVAALILAIGSIAVLLSAQGRNPRALEAERFILKDAKGERRGGMLVTTDGPALEFYDSNRTLRLDLSVFRNTPNLTLKDANGTGTAVLADAPTGPGLMLYDRSGNPRAQLDVGKTGPRLYVEDEKGFSATVGSYFTGDPATDEKLRAASVVLSQKGLGVLWRVP